MNKPIINGIDVSECYKEKEEIMGILNENS